MQASYRLLMLCSAAAGLSLAACDQKQADTPVTQEAKAVDVAAQAGGSGIKPLAGRWQTELKMTNFDIPGMPPSLQKTVGKQINGAGSVTVCLTQADADRNDGTFFQTRGKECRYKTFSMANGQIAAQMTCKDKDSTQAMEMRGSYDAESYDMTLTSSGDIAGAPMNMSMEMTGIRVGDCTGDEAH